MLKLIFACLWYLLPAALGNHNASCGNRLPLPGAIKKALAKLAVPVDLGAKWRGAEIFGPNKTWRGIVVGVATGIIVAGIQAMLFFYTDFFKFNTLVNYDIVNFISFGALLGGGALTGDLVKSFVKRRLGKSPGTPWFPWDQLDWIIGAMAFGCIVYVPALKYAAVTALLYVLVHLASDRVVCALGIKTRGQIN